jgi:DNA-binding transcriptional LysR family regulator
MAGYLAARPAPRAVAELRSHDCICYALQSTGRVFEWQFDRSERFAPQRHLVVNDGGANRAAAVAGAGVIQELDIAVGPDLQTGLLMEILAQRSCKCPPLSIVRTKGRFIPHRVRVVEETILRAVLTARQGRT